MPSALVVAAAIAWRNLHTYLRRPELLVPSLVFPLVFYASFAGGLRSLGHLPAFHFRDGYTGFQFGFILCQTSLFSGLFTGFSLAFDFESGFARRLLLAAADRRGIAYGYAMVALSRAVIALAVVTAVGLGSGLNVSGSALELAALCLLCALLVLIGYGWAAGVAFRYRTLQAGPLMQTPVFLIVFLAPVYVPLPLLEGWIHAVARVNPVTFFLAAQRGLLAGQPTQLVPAFLLALGLDLALAVWTAFSLRYAEAAG